MGESPSTFHVVCRDCRTEAVERTRDAAEAAADRHRSGTDHRVALSQFDRVASPPPASD